MILHYNALFFNKEKGKAAFKRIKTALLDKKSLFGDFCQPQPVKIAEFVYFDIFIGGDVESGRRFRTRFEGRDLERAVLRDENPLNEMFRQHRMQNVSHRHFDFIQIESFHGGKVFFIAQILRFWLKKGHFFSATGQGSAAEIRVDDPFAMFTIEYVHGCSPLSPRICSFLFYHSF
jgi:hypothetical protein